MEKLSEMEISREIKKLTGWKTDGNSIIRKFRTKGFPQTMGLAAAIGALCQQHDHHPDFLTLKYSEVEVSFSTHSVKGITLRDIKIAKDINTLKY